MSSIARDRMPHHAKAWCERAFQFPTVSDFDRDMLGLMRASSLAQEYQVALAVALANEVVQVTCGQEITVAIVKQFLCLATMLDPPHCATACEQWGLRLALHDGARLPPANFRLLMEHAVCTLPGFSHVHRVHLISAVRRLG